MKNIFSMAKKALLVFLSGTKKETLRKLSRALSSSSFNSEIISRNSFMNSAINLKSFSLIIPVGGDGTFLAVAQKNKDVPMLGVNPSPSEREGFFCRATLSDFNSKIRRIKSGKFRTINLARLSCSINNKLLPPSLNEVFFGAEKSYCACRYVLCSGKRNEPQRSSGVIVSTSSGSHAWLSSAGGKKLPLQSDKIQFVVREPYSGKLSSSTMKKGFSQKVKIIPVKNSRKIIVAVDSILEVPVKNRDRIIIKKSGFPLKFIEF
jgi:NAD kinase